MIADMDKVRHLMVLHGLSQREYGKLIGYSESMVCLIMKGRRNLSDEKIKLSAKLFKVKVADIIRRM